MSSIELSGRSIEVSGRSVALNRDGFLENFDDWDEDVAKVLAEKESIQLADCHWTAIRFMRDYYDTYEVAPSPRVMIKEVGSRTWPAGTVDLLGYLF